jgi:hypothetical protein
MQCVYVIHMEDEQREPLVSRNAQKEKPRDGRSRHFVTTRFSEYVLLFGLWFVISAIAFFWFTLFNTTDPDSARSMLSALVQSQAATIVIVVSLTLIAVQLTASACSPRVIDVFKRPKKNPSFWLLLGFYGFSIFYGLSVLKLVEETGGKFVSLIPIFTPSYPVISFEFGISCAYWLGAFSFIILVPYAWNISDLLKPATIINHLASDITKDNFLNSEEDPLQPVMDIVHGSIMRDDIATTRVGLAAVTERVIKIIDSDGEGEISGRFCTHLERAGNLAMSKLDEESAVEVINNLAKFGVISTVKGLASSASTAVEFIQAIGETAMVKDLFIVVWRAVGSLEAVGKVAAEKGFDRATEQAVLSLGHLGFSATEKGDGTTGIIVWSLEAVGKVAAEKRLRIATVEAITTLMFIGRMSVKKALQNEAMRTAKSLAALTFLSEEIVKTAIPEYESKLNDVAFQQFMELYEQELEKLRAEKKASE